MLIGSQVAPVKIFTVYISLNLRHRRIYGVK